MHNATKKKEADSQELVSRTVRTKLFILFQQSSLFLCQQLRTPGHNSWLDERVSVWMSALMPVNVAFINDCTPRLIRIRGAELKIIKVMTVIINRSSWNDLLTTASVTCSPHLLQMRSWAMSQSSSYFAPMQRYAGRMCNRARTTCVMRH